MKKIFSIFAMALGFVASAMALNPYAYGVQASLNEEKTQLTATYSLNAAADSVKGILYLNGAEVASMKLPDVFCTKGEHTFQGTMADLMGATPVPGTYTIGIEVYGTSPAAPTKEATTYQFWSPYSIVIDKNPASANFGRLLITEAQGNVPNTYSTGVDKSGIYVFNPDFTPVMNGERWACYKGGLNLTTKMGSGSANAYSPIRLAISEDGRIFASIQDSTKAAVYELSQDLQTWTPVISGINNGDGTFVDAEGNFVAGLNCSMDVKGSGENLKLLLYSCNMAGVSFAQSGYRLDEYALGTATTFTGTPTHIALFDGNYGLVAAHCAVYYDRTEEGGYWFTANRGGNANEPNLVHFNAAGVRDYYSESANYYGGAGLAQHNGLLYMGGNTGFIQAYTATPGETEMTITATGAQITTGIGRNVNAIEFDYAENMYACSNSGEKLAAFAMPYSGHVVTPVVGFEYVVEAPAATDYYIKHGWADGQSASWTWKKLTREGETNIYSIRDIYGGTGCNWREGEAGTENWIGEPTLVDAPAMGDSAVFAFNATAQTITITKIPAPATINYWLVGTAAKNGWDETAAMPLAGDSIVRHLTAGIYQFKVLVAEASWTGALGYANLNTTASSANVFGSDNVCFELENEGDVTIKVVEGQIVVLGTFKEQVAYDYYIKFAGNGWNWVGMTQAESGNYMYAGVWGGVGANVNDKQSDTGAAWYPEADIVFATETLVSLPVPAVGTEGIYVYDPEPETPVLYFIYDGTPTAIEEVAAQEDVQKVFLNGTLYIRKAGVLYTAGGARVE